MNFAADEGMGGVTQFPLRKKIKMRENTKLRGAEERKRRR